MATINGGEGDDKLTGTSGTDTINGRGGHDTIDGKAGNDTISGGEGDDIIYGGAGNDIIYGGQANSNSVSQDFGSNKIYGGDGDDLIIADIDVRLGYGTPAQSLAQLVYGGSGNDTIISVSSEGKFYGEDGDDTFIGVGKLIDMGAGNDTVAFTKAFGADTVVLGGAGQDTISFEGPGVGDLSGISGFEVWKLVGLNYFSDFVVQNSNFTGITSLTIDGVETAYGDDHVVDASLVTLGSITYMGGKGANTFYGGAKADTFYGDEGADIFKGGAGNDYFDGGDGTDIAVFAGNYANYSIVEVTYNTFTVTDTVGTDGTDTIVDVNKLQFADQTVGVVIRGMEIIGDESAEEMEGGSEADHLDGAGGNDRLDGGRGNDLIEGGTGDDKLIGGAGNDFLYGGTGDDLADYSRVKADLEINLAKGTADGEGKDKLTSIEDVAGGTGDDTIIGNSASNEIKAGSGDDYVDAGAGDDLIVGGDGAGDDTYIGGSGIDTIKYTSAKAGITVNLSASTNQAKSTLAGDAAGIGKDQLSGIENIIAGSYADILTGSSVANTISAGAGDDILDGGAGTAADVLDGGSGADTVSYRSLTSTKTTGVTVNLSSAKDGNGFLTVSGLGGADKLKSIENVTGSAYNDKLTGSSSSNVLIGGAGDDLLDGGSGKSADVLEGGSGTDTLTYASLSATTTTGVTLDLSGPKDSGGYVTASGLGGADRVKSIENVTGSTYNDKLTGSSGVNILNGGDGKDTLSGMAGNDVLKGGAGDDQLIGGTGADDLYGGAGADRFVFNSVKETGTSASTRDTVFDFSSKQGDRIDLRAIDADTKTSGDQKFTFVKDAAFSKKAGELRYEVKSGLTLVHGDVDGDGKADFSIEFDAVLKFSGTDFLL